MIDAHLHVWERSRSGYEWLEEADPRLARDLRFADVTPDLTAWGVTGVILIQADDTRAETDYLLEVAHAETLVQGVVGHIPLHEPDVAAEHLDELRTDPYFVGVRNLTHERSDPDWILRDDVDRSLGLLEEASIPLDYVAIQERHLEHVPTLAARHPDLTIVVDHLAKPPIGGTDEQYRRWRTGLRRAAEAPHVVSKVSGLYGVPDHGGWDRDGLARVLDDALDAFGPERLMYGSDWPVSITAGGYYAVATALTNVLAALPEQVVADLTLRTAQRIYLNGGTS